MISKENVYILWMLNIHYLITKCLLYFNIFNSDLVNISTTFFSFLFSSNVKIIVKSYIFEESNHCFFEIFISKASPLSLYLISDMHAHDTQMYSIYSSRLDIWATFSILCCVNTVPIIGSRKPKAIWAYHTVCLKTTYMPFGVERRRELNFSEFSQRNLVRAYCIQDRGWMCV